MSEEAGVQRAAIPITVLVVEDEESTRKLCADVAESCGMKALVVGTVEKRSAVSKRRPLISWLPT
jgi:predicted dinucleotide-binding enzyme